MYRMDIMKKMNSNPWEKVTSDDSAEKGLIMPTGSRPGCYYQSPRSANCLGPPNRNRKSKRNSMNEKLEMSDDQKFHSYSPRPLASERLRATAACENLVNHPAFDSSLCQSSNESECTISPGVIYAPRRTITLQGRRRLSTLWEEEN
uniref:Uncharacterized protein n=1 Tax=Timspurckia oligopyrenoides TaxID=708627 RepID=A0A7S0ZJG9_9RHOD|mmetsp:Transcript_77/g.131  ORF Transcript_77/g.131 Transcript_77/m.131 type:complete len:147 (+) Transcript_77:110-550(+)